MAQGPGQGTAGPCPSRPDRPLSLYDNLTTEASSGGLAGTGLAGESAGGQRIIQFPDIQFRFDDNIPATLLGTAPTSDARRSVHSTAKSDFFGLGPPSLRTPSPPVPQHAYRTPSPCGNQDGEDVDRAATGTPPRRQRPASDTPDLHRACGASASPDSNASTAPLPGVPSPGETPTHHHHHHQHPDHDQEETPPTSPRSSLRPKSTIKTITIQLPDTSPATRGSPSEAVYMTTTVPQNFTKNANTLIGRHKPTRSSLRHSRMLVVSKAHPQRYPRGNSLNLRHIRLSKLLMVLQILTGALLSLIGLTVMVWSPSTPTKDNPYWSGLILILCGTLFRVLFEFKRSRGGTPAAKGHQSAAAAAGTIMIAPRPPQARWRENCFHVLRVNGLVVLLLTIFFTLLAFIYALIHATNLSSPNLRCEPEFSFNINSSTCVCTIGSEPASRNSSPPPPPPPPVAQMSDDESSTVVDRNWADGTIRLEYRDFNCSEVLGIWYYVTIVSTVLNSIGCLLAATFLVIYGIECMRRDGGGDDQRHPVSRLKANGNNTSSAADGIAPAVCFTSATTSTNVTNNTIDELPSSRPLLMMESGTATTGADEDAVPSEQQHQSPLAETSVLTTDEELDTTTLTSATLLSQSATM
ncbi:uncharacterized protein LOC128278649 [Anopheles cruzii]|uniref:uncharacterized protein LOC128278649 n=1 Tax=Anopheles cruzii TaxID=68878 RepID=UPI0022EC8B8A|nr:uncharacterized protein LOC128278649 [Anopheles cruzii]